MTCFIPRNPSLRTKVDPSPPVGSTGAAGGCSRAPLKSPPASSCPLPCPGASRWNEGQAGLLAFADEAPTTAQLPRRDRWIALTGSAKIPSTSDAPAGGWGSLAGIASILAEERPSLGVLDTLRRQNKPRGHMCTSCAWAKPAEPHAFEFCENGAKATIWDLTRDRCGPAFFADHPLTELRGWSDHDLEMTGRLTHPLRYDAATDRYVETTWEAAFAAIGAALRGLDPKSAVFYASGRASLETAYLYALFARAYGHNNLPDSSNMCHETTSVALKKAIGSPVGTCILSDFESCDMLLFFGQNTGSNSPRFLHPLQDAVRRGCRVVTFNPLREKGLLDFVNPQNPLQMLTGRETRISDIYLQVKPGGDIAAMLGLARHLFELDDARGGVIDRGFIAEHTDGLAAFEAKARASGWEEIEAASGLGRDDLRRVADLYAGSERAIGVYGMGLTQHVRGFENVGMLVNLLLLRGNIGRPGTGICPVRGHSNVQGQRTVGISEKPELVPLDKLATLFGIDPPREKGRSTVEVAEGLLDGSVRAFVGLGGNFARAIPDPARVEGTWAGLDLTVQIATKLNRSHLLPGRSAWLLPCLVRSEEDLQATGAQAVTIEDSLSHIHGSIGRRQPASETLRSEVAIVAGTGRGDAAAEPAAAVAGLDRRLRPRPRPDRRDLPGRVPRLQRPDVHAGRLLPRQRRARTDVEDRQRQGRVHHARGADRAGGAAGTPGR